jgi:hypothetical protein
VNNKLHLRLSQIQKLIERREVNKKSSELENLVKNMNTMKVPNLNRLIPRDYWKRNFSIREQKTVERQ